MSFTSATLFVLLAAPPAGAADAAAAASPMQVQSVWDFVMKGGLMMIPIGICSLIGLALIAERLYTLKRNNVIPPEFKPGLEETLKKSPGNWTKAMAYCRDNESSVANVFAAGIKRIGASLEVVERSIQEAGEREVVKLRKFVRTLSVIAAISPLLGLLGTILGMIKAFQTVAVSAESLGRAELLAGGIYEAMITTAAGLSVAIPVLIAFHFISAKIDGLVVEMDQMSVDFLDAYVEDEAVPNHGAALGTPAAAHTNRTRGATTPSPLARSNGANGNGTGSTTPVTNGTTASATAGDGKSNGSDKRGAA